MWFWVIIIAVPLFDAFWWIWANGQARHLPGTYRWKAFIALWAVLQLVHYLWLMLARRMDFPLNMPLATLSSAYIWHMLVAPISLFLLAAVPLLWSGIRKMFGQKSPVNKPSEALRPADSSETISTPIPKLTRRQLLRCAAIIIPPAITIAGTGVGLYQIRNFRVQRREIFLSSLPAELDGFTIAHLSDTHAGKFASDEFLARMVSATNDLQADVAVFTGDLIDFNLRDLKRAASALRKVEARHGLYFCEGNHDLFESRSGFEQGAVEESLNLLVNQVALLENTKSPVEILGLRWGAPDSDGQMSREPACKENLSRMTADSDANAFRILLAHHPHAFDAAGKHGIPLTLAGHTHGGQIMLTDEFGFGPAFFKYWSGEYESGDNRLVVSNGTGNWMPLRIGASAEILHLTLRSRAAS